MDQLARSIQRHGRWLNEGLYLPVSLVLWAYCGLALARYARRGNGADLALAVLVVLLQAFLTVTFGFVLSTPGPEEEPAEATRRGTATALRAAALSVGVILLATTLSIGWGAAHLRPTDPREALLDRPAAEEVRLLREVAEHVSILNAGSTTGLPIGILGEPDPAVVWVLRGFDLQVVDRADAVEGLPLVVAPAEQPISAGYFGEAFPLQRTWSPTWGGRWTARWWLYRETESSPTTARWIALWVREDLAVGGE